MKCGGTSDATPADDEVQQVIDSVCKWYTDFKFSM